MEIGLRTGFTTGACAAAAAKAAALALCKGSVNVVEIKSPSGQEMQIRVKECEVLNPNTAEASVVKDSGDDTKFDVTHGLEICARVSFHNGNGITVKGGDGVGIVTKPGLPVPVGQPAINPVPRGMIVDSVREILPSDISAEVLIRVPDGTKIADRTFNPKLGILGGISILGTTGIVKPHCLKAFIKSMAAQIDVAVAQGYTHLILVPGNISEKIAKELFDTPTDTIIQTGDFVGYMIRKTVEKDAKQIVILGHPGKLVKLAAGIFNTNHRVADARREVVAAYAALAGASRLVIKKIIGANTTEEMAKILDQSKLSNKTFNLIAEAVKERINERTGGRVKVNVVIVSLEQKILGYDSEARGLKIWRRRYI
jgi:cobalt-precorrin-5B (C1)-methyltransferase